MKEKRLTKKLFNDLSLDLLIYYDVIGPRAESITVKLRYMGEIICCKTTGIIDKPSIAYLNDDINKKIKTITELKKKEIFEGDKSLKIMNRNIKNLRK